MKGESSTQNKAGNKSQYPITIPKNPTLDSLKVITDNFSSKREIGRGAFGVVYKVQLHTLFPNISQLQQNQFIVINPSLCM